MRWLFQWFRAAVAKPRRPSRPRSFRPRVEQLEERQMLSSLPGAPVLNSNPTAPASLFLDFDGHYEATWGAYSNLRTPVFDVDGNPSAFNSQEAGIITEVWQRVTESYSPFNINVTTVQPANLSHGHSQIVAIGGSSQDWYKHAAGGVCYVGSFTNAAFPNVAYVFATDLYNNGKYLAVVSAHEAGHAFGLLHQSVYGSTGQLANEYNPGTSSNAPIMGYAYTAARATWWYGTSTGPTVYQDDLAVIAGATNAFGYRADDVADSAKLATPLAGSGNTLTAAGIIGKTNDADWFVFRTGTGQVTIQVDVAKYGALLDAKLELWSGSTLIASADPSTTLGAAISKYLNAGIYCVAVKSHGSYGDVGQYSLTAVVTPWADQQLYQLFVTQSFQTYLGRAPTATELTSWTNKMVNGTSYAAVEASLVSSGEYFRKFGPNNTTWIKNMYKQLLNRDPTLDKLNWWNQRRAAGLSAYDVALAITSSAERTALRRSAGYY